MRSLGALVAALLIAGLAVSPLASAHGPGARYIAFGTASIGPLVFDAVLEFNGVQDPENYVGGAWFEMRLPGTEITVHALSFTAQEDLSHTILGEDCGGDRWFITEPYGLHSYNVDGIIELGGAKRVCQFDGHQDNEFVGTYLGVFDLDLEVHGVY